MNRVGNVVPLEKTSPIESFIGSILANILTGNIFTVAKRKRGSEMTSALITYFVCTTIALCYYLYCQHHSHCHVTYEIITSKTGTASSGVSCTEESGEHPVGARDRTAPGNEKSEAADGMP